MRGGRSSSSATYRPGRLAKTSRWRASTSAHSPIGERWRAGTALLEVSEPRIPCFKLAWRMQSPTFPKRFGKAMRFGTYFRIIEEGEVEAGSPMTFERAAPEPTLSSRDVARIYMFDHGEKQKLAPHPRAARAQRGSICDAPSVWGAVGRFRKKPWMAIEASRSPSTSPVPRFRRASALTPLPVVHSSHMRLHYS